MVEKTQGVITRDEWIQRFAARCQDVIGKCLDDWMEAARLGATEHERACLTYCDAVVWWGGPCDEHETPENYADEYMYALDDEECVTSSLLCD